jgi:mycothiol synthase
MTALQHYSITALQHFARKTMIKDSTINISTPDIAGLRFRMFAGEADLEPSVVLNNICARAEGDDWVDTLADAQHWLANVNDRSNPYRNMIFGEVNGQMIARANTGWHTNDEGEWIYWLDCVVHPDWQGKGIGRAMLGWQEQHIRELAASHDNAGAPKFFNTWSESRQTARIALLEEAGYTAVRFGYAMQRSLDVPIPDLALPAGFELRPAKPEHYRAIFDADNEAFRDHWGHREQTDEDYQRWLTGRWFQPELFRVAWDIEKNEVAGMVLNFVDWEQNKALNRKRGYTEGISVRRPYRKMGIAKTLIALSLHLHKSLGMTEAALGVDAQNPTGALQLYQHMGFEVERQGTTYRKGIGD